MTAPFGAAYAGSYDTIYGAKDYGAECSLIETLLRSHARGPVASILDLGCGTGNHAIPLAQRGYAVTGVDRSQPMRYFFLQELKLFLSVAGFELVEARTLDSAATPTDNDWNMVCVARAISA